ncbi:MAG: DNA mismatch repair protein MutS [Bdellovibrionales bacterium]|nr:DNA mismatch repair protein MutS [Bdellovibrionales bacterium]
MTSKTLITIQNIVNSGQKLTPMMEQFYGIKKKCPDIYLFFRMGDFYELFFDDAVEVSKLLHITLTHRGKIGDFKIPMAGIPYHAATSYIDRLTSAGHKVAICEQTQDPKDAVGIVERSITQIVSPALPYDLDSLKEENHFIATCYGDYACLIDFTSGDFLAFYTPDKTEQIEKIKSYSPKEFLCFMGQWNDIEEMNHFIEHHETLKTTMAEEVFSLDFNSIYIEPLIPGYKKDQFLKNNNELLIAVGVLGYYISTTQSKEVFYHVQPLVIDSDDGLLKSSSKTLEGLEILPRYQEKKKDSLLGLCDRTVSSMGSRKLRNLFQKPLTIHEKIEQRLEFIEYYYTSDSLDALRNQLKEIRDIERILAKASHKKLGAQDLLNLANTIVVLEGLEIYQTPILTKPKGKKLKSLKDLSNQILETLNDEIGASLEKGNLILPKVHKQRDKFKKLLTHSSKELEVLEEKYKKKSGISKLRIKSNNVFGYFIEVSKSHTHKVPKSFQRKQTLVNSERFTTSELIKFENEVLIAKDKLERIEKEIFNSLVDETVKIASTLIEAASFLATLDAFLSLAYVARAEGFSRPKISPNQKLLEIRKAWHPLIKRNLEDQFICHDLTLDESEYFGLITGPNMAGKTTVMREMAIIQFLAQIGSFIPAKKANLGICDFLFSRLGASDDIQSGQSTFMVEMCETAEILRHASSKSLIILDEVGRGTSTYDGLSIAWALTEHLIKKVKALTLFATHYHELIEVAENEIGSKNLTMETINNEGEVRFMYNLIESAATQSYGLYVAKLAGLPQSLLNKSKQILKNLEGQNTTPQSFKTDSQKQLCFFDSPTPQPLIPEYLENLEKDILGLDINNMTPIEALSKLGNLKDQIRQ